MGRIVPVKGFDVLVKAVAEIDKAKILVDVYGPNRAWCLQFPC